MSFYFKIRFVNQLGESYIRYEVRDFEHVCEYDKYYFSKCFSPENTLK